MAGFDANALWTLVGIVGLSMRDLGTRMLPQRISTPFVAAWALLLISVLGLVVSPLSGWTWPTASAWLLLVGTSAAICVAFICVTTALRTGEVSAIAPFRYTRIVFALILGFFIFGEVPDAAVWGGTALIIATGLYAFWRESQLARR